MKKLILLALLFFISNCSYYINPQQQKSSEEDNSGFSENTVIDFKSIQSVSLKVCLQCHNGQTTPNLSNYTSLRSNLNLVWSQVLTNKMPPPAQGFQPLSDCQKNLLKTWIESGAPETGNQLVVDIPTCRNGASPAPENPLSQLPLVYETFATQILQVKCLKCHNPQSDDYDASTILLFPYSELTAHRDLLGTSAQNSKLIKILTANDDSLMPPADSNESRLNPEQINFVRRWLDAGHPEK